MRGDVSVEAEIDHVFAAADWIGTLVGLVNKAGVVDAVARVEDFDMARLTRMFAINTLGTIICAGRAVRRMSTRHGGKGGGIVNVIGGLGIAP